MRRNLYVWSLFGGFSFALLSCNPNCIWTSLIKFLFICHGTYFKYAGVWIVKSRNIYICNLNIIFFFFFCWGYTPFKFTVPGQYVWIAWIVRNRNIYMCNLNVFFFSEDIPHSNLPFQDNTSLLFPQTIGVQMKILGNTQMSRVNLPIKMGTP